MSLTIATLQAVVAASLSLSSVLAQLAPVLTPAQKETFLQQASIQSSRGAKKGVTGTVRATLSDGTLTHDASIQTIDEVKQKFEGLSGTEYNFQDSYKLNIAGWKIARILGLQSMVPVSVERSYQGHQASFTWWVEDVQMDEADRMKKKLEAPSKDRWSRQFLIMKAFDNLIYNVDRNATNMLYDKEWNLWLIDTSRSFRRQESLQDVKILTHCDAELLASLKMLNEADLKKEIGQWVDPGQIRALLKRRTLLVNHFEAMGPEKLYQYLSAN